MQKWWVKLWRKLLDNRLLMHDDAAFKAFIVLLLAADKNTGEWAGGREQLALLTKQSEFVAYRAVKRLEKAGMLHRKVHSKYTVYRIENWEKYQGNDAQVSAHQVHSKRTASAHSNKKEEVRSISPDGDIPTRPRELSTANQDAIRILETWKRVHGQPPRGGNVKTYFPARRLAENYGVDTVCKAIEWAEKHREQYEYIPVFNNPLDLEQKWPSLAAAYKRLQARRNNGGTIVLE